MKKFLKIVLAIIVLLFLVVGSLELFSSYTPSVTIHKDAPVTTRQSITINATAEKVWKLMAGVDGWKSWQKDIPESKINGAAKPGTTFNWSTGGLIIHSTFHTATPYTAIGWSGKAFGAFAIHNWTFTESAGVTTVIVEESMEGWLVSLMKNKFQTGLGPATLQWLHYLKNEAEKK